MKNVCMLANNFTKRKNKYMGFIWWISCGEFEGEVINGINNVCKNATNLQQLIKFSSKTTDNLHPLGFKI